MNIASGHKFGCFAYSGFAAEALAADIHLGPRVWCSTSLGFEVEEYWQRWLGEIKAKQMRDVSFVLYTTLPSQTPNEYGGENMAVTNALSDIVYGLLLQGVPHFETGCSLSGANIDGTIDVQEFSDLEAFVTTDGLPVFRPRERHLRHAVTLAKRVRLIAEGRDDWARLRRGLRALWVGSGLLDLGDRLHQFVRALEAVLIPELGNTRTQFAHRIDQTFVRANDDTRAALLQIFDLRSRVEHMHPAIDALDGDRDTRIATAHRRTRQADILARFVLSRILESDALFNTFKTEASIESFWKMDAFARGTMWGGRLDLTSIP